MTVADSVTIDSLVVLAAQEARQAEVARIMGPYLAGSRRAALVRVIWFAGVCALQRDDRAAARRAAAVLDSLAGFDTVALLPRALGLRGELALASGDSAGAESLLVQAIRTSVTHTPGRYRWLLARRYASTNHPDLAERLAHTLTMPSRLHRQDDAFYFARALKLEAEMLEQQGRPDAAATKYQEYADLRADADSALQGEVGGVHQRLARLAFDRHDYVRAWYHVKEARHRGAAPAADFLDALRRAQPEPTR